ncbi:MAG: 4a-hydroxytetrahydrobiopterin dehydratase [Gammaproteobacteria bacterium]|nr:4a-hydroxytetrahydrobiopterin dehydratase [Gammaproteobacteria bacterium]NIR97873.1 4a-hydroxytetrahydrobiopterin dehydratase [Gammaproteobacteria bacterium]NIT63578.1 4a-hydroxytetrahydrobiopterin dehydratase [Gammaproteobacteria bacterium]NIV20514.1 4a-hydroxytetrahydrobiopterin dehydratase [Gammaproteobacteria bacterium]NIX11108.1 4a-hydroxytetrahydrobiopterin dehydratase [Gammaproteobacteria bacterium]
MTDLSSRHCTPPQKGGEPLPAGLIAELRKELHPDWGVEEDGKRITRGFEFKNFYHTMAFVNALAWIANQEDHHPDLEVSYKRCIVHFTTHALGGLSENDFICAAKADALLT